MFLNNVNKFISHVLADAALQESFFNIQDRLEFLNKFISLGKDSGYNFTAKEFDKTIKRNKLLIINNKNIKERINTLHKWLPIEIKKIKSKIYVQLCYIGDKRFVEPFFHDSIAKCLRNPFANLLRQNIELNDFIKLSENTNGLKPALFIFHMSRCGSTLVSQMLASLEQNIVYSEPIPVDDILRIDFDSPKIKEDQRAIWLKAVINKLSEPRFRNEKNLFIKFDSWLITALPLIRKVFPDVPCIFLYRSPIEVLVSHNRHRGRQMVPGLIEPGWFGFEKEIAVTTDFNLYTAKVLEKIMNLAVEYSEKYSLKLINYDQLPDAVLKIPGILNDIKFSDSELNRLKQAAMRNAKEPASNFNNDSQEKRKEATKELIELSDRYLSGLYEKLEVLRLKQEK